MNTRILVIIGFVLFVALLFIIQCCWPSNSCDNFKDSDCTPSNKDPYQSGNFVPCCSGSVKTLVDDPGNNPEWHYKCIPGGGGGGGTYDLPTIKQN